MRRLTVSELLTATGGTLLAGGESAAVTSVSTDSRKAGEGAQGARVVVPRAV